MTCRQILRYGRTGGRDLLGLAAEAGKAVAERRSWPSNLTTRRLQFLQPAQRWAARRRGGLRAGRSNSIRASPTPMSISPRPTPSAIGISRRNWNYSTRTPAREAWAILPETALCADGAAVSRMLNRASPRLSILPWHSSHDRLCLPRPRASRNWRQHTIDRSAPSGTPAPFQRSGTSNHREMKALRLYQPPHIGELVDRGTHASKIQPLIPK